MRIALVTPVYGRYELTRIVLEYYAGMNDQNLVLIAAGSEGEKTREICEGAGWNYIESPNEPLTQKFQSLFLEARKHEVDAVIVIGSDDLISRELFDYYQTHFHKDTEALIGLRDFYFYKLPENILRHWKGYSDYFNQSLGAGRLYPKSILDKVDWKPWGIVNQNQGCDNAASRYLKLKGIQEKRIFMHEIGCMAVDIKHHRNLTKFHQLRNATDVPNELFSKFFPGMFTKLADLTEKENSHAVI